MYLLLKSFKKQIPLPPLLHACQQRLVVLILHLRKVGSGPRKIEAAPLSPAGHRIVLIRCSSGPVCRARINVRSFPQRNTIINVFTQCNLAQQFAALVTQRVRVKERMVELTYDTGENNNMKRGCNSTHRPIIFNYYLNIAS